MSNLLIYLKVKRMVFRLFISRLKKDKSEKKIIC